MARAGAERVGRQVGEGQHLGLEAHAQCVSVVEVLDLPGPIGQALGDGVADALGVTAAQRLGLEPVPQPSPRVNVPRIEA